MEIHNMKKILVSLFILPLLALAGSCTKQEIVFDHELPAFETKDGQILLEVIMPNETVENDVIYISGEFNGGDDAAASDSRWHLEKSTVINGKWGIYLDPASFSDGKTLADGYRFVSVNSGEERSPFNKAVIHTENPAPGTRANIYVNKWASFFDVPATIEHDGYAIYVEDNTGWDAITLYCWGDSEVFGGWPGAQVTGTEKIDGKTYKYFDTGADNAGKTINLILNNNNGGSQLENFDVLKSVVLNKNYFFSFSSDNVEAIEVEQPYYIYLADNSEWDDIALYAWGDAEVFGGWPGAQTTGKTVTVNGITYKQFELPAEAIGKNLNLIFNNNNNGVQAKDFSQFTPEAHDYYLMCDGAATVEVDPKTGEPIGGAVAPEPGAIIYIDNQTSWKLFAHYWEEGGASTQWPGQEFTESSEIDGVNYQYIVTDKKFEGKTVGIIFHNDGSETERVQTSVILDKDRYYRLTTEGLEEVSL